MVAAELTAQCQRLGIPLNTRHSKHTAADRRRVALVFAEHGSAWSRKQMSTFERLVAEGINILPVIPKPSVARFLPECISHVNAFVRGPFGRQWPLSLVDEILSIAWMRRRTRKIFISYRRIDSGKIATQLYERFNGLGYETFLDEASVRRGVDFQRELKWWLNDADLLLVLASPRFPKSRWCMEELVFCQQRFIGVAAIQWPEEIYSGQHRLKFPQIGRKTGRPVILEAAMQDQQLKLVPGDFSGLTASWQRVHHPDLPARELTPAAIDRIVAMCAGQRAVAIRQRLNDLLPLARSLLSAPGKTIQTRKVGDLVIRDGKGKRSLVRVLPFRPLPESIHQSCTDAAGYDHAGCFYAENDPQDERAEALRWLVKAKRPRLRNSPSAQLWATCGGELL